MLALFAGEQSVDRNVELDALVVNPGGQLCVFRSAAVVPVEQPLVQAAREFELRLAQFQKLDEFALAPHAVLIAQMLD